MIATRFDYHAPTDVPAAVALLGPGARVLAGGTWVLPELGRGESRPERLVDLRRAGLDGIDVRDGEVRLGAMTTYSAVLGATGLAARAPLLTQMAGGVTGGWALRNQATLVGSLAAARVQSEVPAVLAACEAVVEISGGSGPREMAARDVVLGNLTTALAVDEMITGIRVPDRPGWGAGYVKLKHGASSWPIATAAALVRLLPDGTCASARLVLGAVAATPVEVDLTCVVGTALDDNALAAVAACAHAAVPVGWTDPLAPGDYRTAVVGPAARRAVRTAAAPAATSRPPTATNGAR